MVSTIRQLMKFEDGLAPEEFDEKIRRQKALRETGRWKTRQRIVIAINAFMALLLLYGFIFFAPATITAWQPTIEVLIGWVAILDMAFFGLKGVSESADWGKVFGKE